MKNFFFLVCLLFATTSAFAENDFSAEFNKLDSIITILLTEDDLFTQASNELDSISRSFELIVDKSKDDQLMKSLKSFFFGESYEFLNTPFQFREPYEFLNTPVPQFAKSYYVPSDTTVQDWGWHISFAILWNTGYDLIYR